MATATATKRKKTTKKASLKSTLVDLNSALINNSEELIENTIVTGEKYQKLFAKTIKKSEPIVEKQVDIVFDAIESLKDQFDFGTVRFKKLIGWNDKTITKLRKSAAKNIESFKKTAEESIDAVQTELNERIPVIPAPTKSKKVTVSKKKSTVKATPAKKVIARKTKAVKATKIADLKVIDGIGPKMEKVLIAGGIKTINGLAKATVTKIEKIVERSGSSFRAINSKSWIAQAKKINK